MSDAEKKIKVMLLTDCLADLAGGAEKQIYELAKGLDKNRYDVFVVSLDTWGEAPAMSSKRPEANCTFLRWCGCTACPGSGRARGLRNFAS